MGDVDRFRWSDAWLLHAIAVAGGDGDVELADVIASGDALNHAIFTDGELHNGLHRLIDAGYVVAREHRVSLIGAAQDAWRRLRRKNASNARSRDGFRELLGVPRWPPGPMEPIAHPDRWPTADDIAAAVRRYGESTKQRKR